jgi:peptidyl-dipeptidase Dcp
VTATNAGHETADEPATLSSDNPFASPSTLPFGAPPFDRIRDEHYQPAIEEGMRQHRAEVAAIATQDAPPTFENTIAALEGSGVLLTRVLKAFGGVTSANTNDYLQAVQSDVAPKLAAHSDAIYLDDRLFDRVRAIYDARHSLGLRDEEFQLVERYHLDFVRAGARLSDPDKERLKVLNQEESRLTTEFQNRLLAANKAGALVISDVAELEGLSESDIAAAAEAAAERGLAGRWLIRLQNTTQQPVQDMLRRRDVRRRLFEAAIHRADRGDAYDTSAIVLRLADLRAERARLLGYPNAAAYTLDDQMAKTPEAAVKLLVDIGTAAIKKARAEADRMRPMIAREPEPFELEAWDWQFYAEQVRKADYDLDEAQIKPYLELDRVLRDGVFFAATRMFGLTFRERHDIPVYHPDVRVFDVFDEDGSQLALFYADYFKRDNKSGGAWMDSFVDQSEFLGARPVVFNVTNYTKPVPGQPALLSFDEVTTLFHEFGHALHGMLSRVRYPTLSGTNVPRDFVEFPSQFNEHCALDPVVLANYARHHRTGEPMPQAMVDRIKRARTFNQGFALTEYIGAALLDIAWHTDPTARTAEDIGEFEVAALARHGIALPQVPPRYRSTYFAHIWDGGYGGGYYAYLWAEVLDHDAFAWFQQRGGLNRENGQHYREMILSCGGTRDAAELYRAFRGADPDVSPLLTQRGLGPTADPAA